MNGPARERVSVAIATYNGERFLREQLDSIAAQTRAPFEVVISDDHSTDATVHIAQAFAAGVPFPVHVVPNDSGLRGIVGNFLNAFAHCQGDLIAYCDQDDVWDRPKLEVCLDALADPRVALVIHRSRIVDEHLGDLGHSLFDFDADRRVAFPSFIHAVGGFGHQMVFDARLRAPMTWLRSAADIDLKHLVDNFDAMIPAVAGMSGDIVCIAQDLTRFRRHGNATSPAGKDSDPAAAHGLKAKLAGKRWTVNVLNVELRGLVRIGAVGGFPNVMGLAELTYGDYIQRLSSHFAKRESTYKMQSSPAKMGAVGSAFLSGAYAPTRQGGCGVKALLHDLGIATYGIS